MIAGNNTRFVSIKRFLVQSFSRIINGLNAFQIKNNKELNWRVKLVNSKINTS